MARIFLGVFDTFCTSSYGYIIAILATNKKKILKKNKNKICLHTLPLHKIGFPERESSGRESAVLDERSRRRLYSTVVDSWFRTAKPKAVQLELSSLHSLACHRPVERRARIVVSLVVVRRIPSVCFCFVAFLSCLWTTFFSRVEFRSLELVSTAAYCGLILLFVCFSFLPTC